MYRRDRNHGEIQQALLDAGRPVHDVSRHHGLGCDIVTEHRDGSLVLLEVKRPGPPSARKLTASETALQAKFPASFVVVQSISEALLAVGIANFT